MKVKRISRRLLAGLLCVALCITYFPTIAMAAGDEPYGITAAEGTTIESLSALDDQSIIDNFSKDAAKMAYGAVIDMDAFIPTKIGVGKVYSPFSMMASSETGTVDFSIAVPEPETYSQFLEAAAFLNCRFKVAVQRADVENAPILYFDTTYENGVLNVSIPTSGETVNCALVFDITPNLNVTENKIDVAPEEILENSEGSSFPFVWTVSVDRTDDHRPVTHPFDGLVVIKATNQMTLDLDSVCVDSQYFEISDKQQLEDGSIYVTLKETESFANASDDERREMLRTEVKISYNTSLDQTIDFNDGESVAVPYSQFMIWSDNYDDASGVSTFSACATSDVTKTATMRSAVTITPADLTIYEGGDGGYDAIYDGENSDTPVSSASLPHPLFKITAPKGSGIDPADLTFTVGNKSWTVVPDGENTGLYHFSEVEGQDKVRVQYTNNATGEVVTSDEFDPNAEGIKDTFNTYTIDLYAGENNLSEVRAGVADSGTDYPISVNSGTLTVRAVEADDPTSDVVVGAEGADLVPAEEQVPAANEAVALVPAGTTYTLNGLEGVTLPQDAKPSLLFDDIIKSDGVDRETPLKAATDTALGGAAGDNVTRTYQTKYLDLVDANNGNAWIKASDNVTIYWGYPEGTDTNTEFKIVHFQDLHRDNSNGNTTGFNPDDINADNVEVFSSDATDEALKLETTDQGIKFEVTPGNFSPYVLVWDVDNTPDPGPDPDPSPGPGPVHPVDPTPELERGDHYAYIVGYEDDTIRPQNNITRAEVATIFFRLLTDESREAYFTTDCDFTDVNGSAWYANTVATLSNAGILAGYPDGSFRPNDPITRAEFAAIATRFDDLAAADSTFTDIDGHWAEDAINAAYGAGWVGGYPDGTFRPNNNITRAEVMSLVNRVLDREVDEDGMLDDMLTWIDNEPGTWYYEAVQEATNSHDYEREDADSVETWTQINEPIDWDQVEEALLNSH